MNPPQQSTHLVDKIDLTFECRNLINLDRGLSGKSDCKLVIYESHPRNTTPGTPPFQRWVEIGRTETIKDDLNPTFNKTIQMDYHFEEHQSLRFLAVDIDNDTTTVMDDDIIGEVFTSLGEIAGSPGQRLTREIIRAGKPGQHRGNMIVQLQQVNDNIKDIVHMELQGIKLAKKDLFSSDPYVIIKRQHPTNPSDWIVVYRTETIMSNLNPKWKPFSVKMNKWSPNGDPNVPLLVECWDFDKHTEHDLIGTYECTLQDLLNRVSFTLKSNKGKSAGTIAVPKCEVERVFGFLDYISRGCEISLVTAIDWTGSNGDPRTPKSLHYRNPHAMNPYQQVIHSVGNILGYYDRDQLFPAYGFGGKLPGGQVSHCFALNGNPQQPQCHGIGGIMQAYHQALDNVQLYGPTHFSEIIKATSGFARADIQGNITQKYYVLLIITDGVINDMSKTVDLLVEASDLPISVVIVGVGNADFSAMVTLDGDNKKLRSPTKGLSKRDAVQFVPFNKYANMPCQELAREVLAEIPSQLEQYFLSKKIRPMGL